MTKEQFTKKFLEVKEEVCSNFCDSKYLNNITKELENKGETYICAFNACLGLTGRTKEIENNKNTLEEVYNTAEVFRFDDSDYELLLKYMVLLNIVRQIKEQI